jgi:hypothetical protein
VRLALTEQNLVFVEQGAPPMALRVPLLLLLPLSLTQRHLSSEGPTRERPTGWWSKQKTGF